MSEIIEIRNLKKGDIFLYNGVNYEITETEKWFTAVSMSGFHSFTAISNSNLKLKVKLISRANENTNI